MPEIAEGSLNSVILECHKHMDIKLAEMLMLQSEGYNIWTEDLDAEEVDSVDILLCTYILQIHRWADKLSFKWLLFMQIDSKSVTITGYLYF